MLRSISSASSAMEVFYSLCEAVQASNSILQILAHESNGHNDSSIQSLSELQRRNE